jgi:hypothetical protein
MAAADEKWPLARAALMIQRTAALWGFAVGHRLKKCSHRRAEQFRQMRAGLEPADLLPDQFAPSVSDAFAHQALQYRFNLDAGRIRRRTHSRLCFDDSHGVIDRKA